MPAVVTQHLQFLYI